jgi:hypothetical protein
MHGLGCTKSSVDVANDALLMSALTDGTLVLSNVHKVGWQRSCNQGMQSGQQAVGSLPGVAGSLVLSGASAMGGA